MLQLKSTVHVKRDREWFGQAQFKHPSPASPAVLRSLFPFYSPSYTPVLHPPSAGETIDELHERVAYVLTRVIADLDADPSGPRSVLICTHAATLIAIGRVLTGHMPIDAEEQDFLPYTAGLSVFVRRSEDGVHKDVAAVSGDVEDLVPDTRKSGNGGPHAAAENESHAAVEPRSANTLVPAKIDWRQGKGVQGGWTCIKNGDCSCLSGGAERGWYVFIYSLSLLCPFSFPSLPPFPPERNLPIPALIHLILCRKFGDP